MAMTLPPPPPGLTPDRLRTLPYRHVGLVDGLPLRWQDEVTGVLRAAIWAYLEQRATPDDCRWVLAWIGYFLAAPCWTSHGDPEDHARIQALRERVGVAPPEPQAILDLIYACLEVGIDPL